MLSKENPSISSESSLLPETSSRSPIDLRKIPSASIRFCGDSGDGMQLTGLQFTTTTGIAGNDLMTLPDFPAEIRAPQGTTAGVSGFQIHFASQDVYTPGDKIDLLVAMNPAALKTNQGDLKRGGILIINSSSFHERNLTKAGYDFHPMEGDEGARLKEKFSVISVPISELTLNSLKDLELPKNQAERCKNFFALGMTYWLFERKLDHTLSWIEKKFAKKDILIEANQKLLKAGYYFAETCEFFSTRYEIDPVISEPGFYRNLSGSNAIALGLLVASKKAKLPLFYAGYPITPASEILHELSMYRNFNVKTFQAEDEIAAAAAAVGASYGGSIGVTASSGPGIMLKEEAISLSVTTELPLIIIDAQRAGPSTGMPTKTEQGDLHLALFGRSSDSPIPILAPFSPADSFLLIQEAVRIALRFMTPVFFLSDLYLIMGSEPWKIPDTDLIAPIEHGMIREGDDPSGFSVMKRDSKTLARRWAVPGIDGFEHRIGGLEKDVESGNVSYDPQNHEKMVLLRRQKIENISSFIPELEVFGEKSGGLLLLGWGSSYGAIREAVLSSRGEGTKVSHVHLQYLYPFPRNLGDILQSYDTILVPELNLGQLSFVIQGKFGIQLKKMTKVTGKPFLVSEIYQKIRELA